MSIKDTVTGWIFTVALGKAAKSLAKLIVSFCAAKGIAVANSFFGIAIDTNDVLIMTAAINSGLKMLFNWLKVKWPKLTWLP